MVCIDKLVFKRLGKPKLKQTNFKIIPFGSGESLEVKGMLEGTFEANGKYTNATANVIGESKTGCMLSKTVSQQFNLIKFSQAVRYEMVNAVSGSERIGKMKGVQIKLHIEGCPSSGPTTSQNPLSPPRHHLVGGWTNTLGCIDRLRGTAESSGSHTYYEIDMRCANKAIKRERHIIPTTDDILQATQGAKWFTKMDMNSA